MIDIGGSISTSTCYSCIIFVSLYILYILYEFYVDNFEAWYLCELTCIHTCKVKSDSTCGDFLFFAFNLMGEFFLLLILLFKPVDLFGSGISVKKGRNAVV